MATWFDLPPEVKQIIFSMVSDADSIIYVPRDRRRKVDVRHQEAHHFHDLFLVSKSFITPDEFASAILISAKLTFYSYNELRRLTTEVPASFKESIRHIHLSRTYYWDRTCTDTFDGFSNIEKTLSTHMPQLRRIYISWPDFCAQVAVCQLLHAPSSLENQDTMYAGVIKGILAEKPLEEMSDAQILRRNSPSHLVASFLGDRNTRRHSPIPYNWTRPLGWIRRLVCYAESNNIEVVLQMNVCIAHVHNHLLPMIPTRQGLLISCCWSIGSTMSRYHITRQTHLEAEMSSRDYMLRLEHDGRRFAYHQKLAYDLLHASANRRLKYWLDMVEEVNARSLHGDYMF